MLRPSHAPAERTGRDSHGESPRRSPTAAVPRPLQPPGLPAPGRRHHRRDGRPRHERPGRRPGQTSDPPLPTIRLGPHEVSRLIIGGNPVYGYSHFNKLFSQHLTAWHTPERVLELLRRCEQAGINTFQNSYAERTLSDVDRYRAEGGTMHWLCLGKPDWEQHPEHIADAARHKPIGISPHGALNDRLHRQKKYDVLNDLLKRIRDQGVLVGLSAHDPTLMEEAEERGWDVDYFMRRCIT